MIAPGYITTDNTHPYAPIQTGSAPSGSAPRPAAGGASSELMGAVVILASDVTRYVHGAVLAVDVNRLAP